IQEKVFANAALKSELKKLKGNNVDIKFTKSSILGKPVLQPLRHQSVVKQPTTFKPKRPRISKPRFASQVDVKNDLSKLVTPHYLPKVRASSVVKPHHVIASRESRNSSKNILRFISNDMVHNHYLEEGRKKTHESGRNSKPSVMPSSRSQSTDNESKPKPRIINQKSWNWPGSKSSCITTKIVPIADHSRNSRYFLDFKHFVCSTCQKHLFNDDQTCSDTMLDNENPAFSTCTCPMLHGILRFDGHPSVMMGFLRNIEGIGPKQRLRRSKMSFHQALNLILELDDAAVKRTRDILRARSSNNAQDSLAFLSRSLPPADWSMVRLVTGLTWL
ncbi:hypothetical protein Tco_1342329, partial [Tanacetum coccineum]